MIPSKLKSRSLVYELEPRLTYRLYILFVSAIAAQIPNGVVSNFSSTIISGFGFTVLQTTLLDIPSNVFQIVSLLAGGYLASRFKNCRTIIMVSFGAVQSS